MAACSATTEREGRTQTCAIYATLRDRICLLDHPPGTRLREAALAAEFGVSRTPVRAALQRLAHDGLIESRDGVGTLVTAPEFGEIRDIYRLRLETAALIGRMDPCPIDPAHVAVAEALLARAHALTARFDIREYWRINHDTHALIAGIIGNAALREVWDRLYFQAARMWYAEARRQGEEVAAALVAELTETRAALAERDAVALGYVQRNHIAYGLRRLEAAAARDRAAS
jgi:DNA-binding GntR family transcriptional regulator